jgi:hypothetical protein
VRLDDTRPQSPWGGSAAEATPGGVLPPAQTAPWASPVRVESPSALERRAAGDLDEGAVKSAGDPSPSAPSEALPERASPIFPWPCTPELRGPARR